MRGASPPIIPLRLSATGRSIRRSRRVSRPLLSGALWWRRTPIGCPPACADTFSYACSGVSLVVVQVFGYCPQRLVIHRVTAGRRNFVIPTAYLDARGD